MGRTPHLDWLQADLWAVVQLCFCHGDQTSRIVLITRQSEPDTPPLGALRCKRLELHPCESMGWRDFGGLAIMFFAHLQLCFFHCHGCVSVKNR